MLENQKDHDAAPTPCAIATTKSAQPSARERSGALLRTAHRCAERDPPSRSYGIRIEEPVVCGFRDRCLLASWSGYFDDRGS